MKITFPQKIQLSDDSFSFQPGSADAESEIIIGNSEHKNEYPLDRAKTTKRFYGIIMLVLVIMIGRLIYLQVIQGSYYRGMAEDNRIRTREIKPLRGLIYDNHKNILVENTPNFLLGVVPSDLPKQQPLDSTMIAFLSRVSQRPPDEIQNLIAAAPPNSTDLVVIAENLTHNDAIVAKIEAQDYQGVALETANTRKYLIAPDQSLSHILGYIGRIDQDDLSGRMYSQTDTIGKSGLELEYESLLKGEKGMEQIEVDARGLLKEQIAYVAPRSGVNLLLTIDNTIQKKLEESLKAALTKQKLTRAAAIAIDPRNGEILAMVSLPAFDNNIFSNGLSTEEFLKLTQDPDKPLFNRAIRGQYPSGSTIKPVIAAAALEDDVVTDQTTIYSVGGIQVQRWFFPDWKTGGHGPTNLRKALAESVNTYFYYIGGGYNDFRGLGLQRIIYYGDRIGLGKLSGIDIPGEAAGLLPTEQWKRETKNEEWYIGDTYHVAIGQGDILVTPLQVANWTATIANGGTLYRPHLAKEFFDDMNVIKKINPEIISRNFFSAENLQLVKQGMRDAVEYGSARRLAALPINIAGKTGTAEWSSTRPPHAWFTSFAPYDDPQIVVTILIEEGGEGSAAAVPVAEQFFEWWEEYREK